MPPSRPDYSAPNEQDQLEPTYPPPGDARYLEPAPTYVTGSSYAPPDAAQPAGWPGQAQQPAANPAQPDYSARYADPRYGGPVPATVSEHGWAPAPPQEARAAPVETHQESDSILYVPLAVTVGDGFKFGCGFFLAAVMAMLVGFVLIAALFVLTSLTGVTLPVGR